VNSCSIIATLVPLVGEHCPPDLVGVIGRPAALPDAPAAVVREDGDELKASAGAMEALPGTW
jgi:hypothetical protein